MGLAKRQRERNNNVMKWWLLVLLLLLGFSSLVVKAQHKNAYATMMYVGTPRDYEFYIAIRVLFKSLALLNVQADLVVIASVDVPLRWIRAL
jgi:hypothetical protein